MLNRGSSGGRATWAVTLCLAGLLGVGSAVTLGADSAEASCRPKGATRLAVNRHAEVYTTRFGDFAACLRRARRPRPIDLTGSLETVPYPAVRLKGTVVAFGANVADGAQSRTAVQTYKLRDPKRPVLDVNTFGFVADIVIRNSSSIAWITCGGGTGPNEPRPQCRPPGFEDPNAIMVFKHDSTAGTDESTGRDASTELDVDPDIAVSSLTLNRSIVSWRNGELRRTAPLG